MGYGKYCHWGNCPIWEMLWDTVNTVSAGTVQSGKCYGIREILSVRELSNLGNPGGGERSVLGPFFRPSAATVTATLVRRKGENPHV